MDNIGEAADYLTEYWATYRSQNNYESYCVETFMNDALYGIGIAMDDSYKFGNGYDRFKKDLIEFLQSGEWNPKEEEK